MKRGNISKRIIILIVYSVAMAFVESAVVIDLRAMYYPDGLTFTVIAMPLNMVVVEVLREFATMIMLFTAAWLFGSNKWQRLAAFVMAFAVWDIFYYVWLWLFIGWPAGVLDWDILFLIPVPWVGPVLTPLLVCGVMLIFASLLLYHEARGSITFGWKDWSWLILASFVLLTSWTMGRWDALGSPEEAALDTGKFSWPVFALSMLIYTAGLVYWSLRMKRQHCYTA